MVSKILEISTPKLGEDEPILTSICFKGVETTKFYIFLYLFYGSGFWFWTLDQKSTAVGWHMLFSLLDHEMHKWRWSGNTENCHWYINGFQTIPMKKHGKCLDVLAKTWGIQWKNHQKSMEKSLWKISAHASWTSQDQSRHSWNTFGTGGETMGRKGLDPHIQQRGGEDGNQCLEIEFARW